MGALKTRSLERLEQKIQSVSDDPLRQRVLETARDFKVSWIELGQALYSVWKDKRYKEWGFATFDAYSAKEIGIRKQTAMKLLRSYFFLEKEEPDCLRAACSGDGPASTLPSYESVDVLRLAKNKKELDQDDYRHLKEEIFQRGKDARLVRQDLTALIRQRQELEPEEAFEKKRTAAVRRLVGVLRSLKDEVKSSKLVSAQIIRDAESLIRRLEDELRG